jgi:glycosyltransferase involved in cell wall biosynthesis
MRISHISFSRSGGAGAVARRLVAAQKQAGLDSEFLYFIDTDLKNEPLRHPGHTLAAAVDATIVKNPGFSAMVSLTRDHKTMPVTIRPDRDIIHLHWLNGVSRPGNLRLLPSQAVVWTLHDMNPFTGTCHYSLTCDNYTSGCLQCPAVRPRFHKLVTRNLHDKTTSVHSLGSLTLVSPSAWLANAATNSAIFRDYPIHVIPNPVDDRFFTTAPAPANTPGGEMVGVVIAQDLDDPTKNVVQAVEAFSAHRSATGSGQLVLIGRGGKQFRGQPGVILTGRLDVDGLMSWCDAADHIIVTSEAENAPMVVFEAAARGCWPLVANHSGLSEIPTTLGGGNLFNTVAELTELLALRHNTDETARHKQRLELIHRANEICHPARVEAQYRKVYDDAVSSNSQT